MTDALTYKGEALLLSWSDSTAGRKVTFLLPDDGGQHPFRDYKTGPKYGQAFAIGCAPVDYDNPEPAKPGDPVKSVKGYAKPPMTESQRCALYCQQPDFQKWLAMHFADEWAHFNVGGNGPDDAAACVIRRVLKVTSRRELDDERKSVTRSAWEAMRTAFEADTGRLAERTR